MVNSPRFTPETKGGDAGAEACTHCGEMCKPEQNFCIHCGEKRRTKYGTTPPPGNLEEDSSPQFIRLQQVTTNTADKQPSGTQQSPTSTNGAAGYPSISYGRAMEPAVQQVTLANNGRLDGSPRPGTNQSSQQELGSSGWPGQNSKAFGKIDANKDGAISPSEFEAAMHNGCVKASSANAPKNQVPRVAPPKAWGVDQNRDGVSDTVQVSPRVSSSPSAVVGIDANGDGRANYFVRGSDRNFDGIPDSIQGSCPSLRIGSPMVDEPLPHSPRVAPPSSHQTTWADASYHQVEAPYQDTRQSLSPIATVGVDTTGDGRANYIVKGIDRNRDGIPDALQYGQTKAVPTSPWMQLHGWTLLASTTSSDAYVVDNIKMPNAKPWQSSVAEAGQWIRLTAPGPMMLDALRVRRPVGWRQAYFRNFQFQFSHDEANWIDATAGVGSNQDGDAWQEFTFPTQTSKYWRMYMRDAYGSGSLVIGEMQVRGHPEAEGPEMLTPTHVYDGYPSFASSWYPSSSTAADQMLSSPASVQGYVNGSQPDEVQTLAARLANLEAMSTRLKVDDSLLARMRELEQEFNTYRIHGTCTPPFGGASHAPPRAEINNSDTMEVGGQVRMLQTQYLVGFREECKRDYGTVPTTCERSDFTIDGTIDDVARVHPELRPVLYNDVKICDKCRKPNGFSLRTCNACGASLESTAITKAENIFVAFLLGVKKSTTTTGFNLTISLRRQTDDVIVFDDPLAMSPCHFCGIPTQVFCPDWRYLLNCPRQSLQLLDRIEAECWEAQQQFMNSSDFCSSVFRGGPRFSQAKSWGMKGFNFPPSQFQLHLQWQVPPLTPQQQNVADAGGHWTEGRWFPLEYVRRVLSLNKPYAVEKNTPVEDIIEYYRGLGVNYSAIWREAVDNFMKLSREFQNWKPNQFKYVVQDGKPHEFTVVNGIVVAGKEVPTADFKDLNTLHTADRMALQNCGRPYTAEGKASGTYLKKPLRLQYAFNEWPGVVQQEKPVAETR